MLCSKQDSYVHKLLMEDIEIIWKCTLSDGQIVLSDYDRPGEIGSPWERLMNFCEETGEPIGLKRLMARPVATLCIAAQEKHEKEEKVYADD